MEEVTDAVISKYKEDLNKGLISQSKFDKLVENTEININDLNANKKKI